MKLPNIKDSEIFKTPRVRKDYLQRKNCTLVNSGKKKSKEHRLKCLRRILYLTELLFNTWDKIKPLKKASQNFSMRVEGSQKNFLMEARGIEGRMEQIE